MANRLANDFKRGDFSALDDSKFRTEHGQRQDTSVGKSLEGWSRKGRVVDASLEPRTWSDFWRSRRRLKIVGGHEVIESAKLGKSFPELHDVKQGRIFNTAFEISTGLTGTDLINGESHEVTRYFP